MKFSTHVAGIPCVCLVLRYEPSSPALIYKDGGGEPPEPEEFEFDILDRKGYTAPWLENKLTDRDISRLKEEYLQQAKKKQFDHAY